VCCYPDYQRLLSAAGSHADRMLVFSHPADNLLTRSVIGSENLLRGLGRNSFRAYVHPPQALVVAAEATGLTTTYRHHAWDWEVVGLVR
jgi:magnesium-protoporphyrin O-methyltransferase